MSRIVEIGDFAFRLPERGMPIFISPGIYPDEIPPEIQRAGRGDGQGSGMDVDVPSAQFLPVAGLGFFGWPAILGHREGREHMIEFSGWSWPKTGETLILEASDAIAHLAIRIWLSFSKSRVLSSSVTLTNTGMATYTLDRCMAISLVADAGVTRLTSFHGEWGREFQTAEAMLGHGLWLQENRKGRTSHDKFPGLILDVNGVEHALHLGWSGNHVLAIDRLDDGRRLLHAGELFEPGEVRLEPGQSYVSPRAHFSRKLKKLREFVRSEIIVWPGGQMRPRPVTLNTWEGNYFDHRIDSLKDQANAAAKLGVERFVLDDGWFKGRNSDRAGLGDWFVNSAKYPRGLGPLCDHVLKLGMEFGIWVEPEMVNSDSDLFRTHPDWVLRAHGRPLLTSRNQLVLDLTRNDVIDYLFMRLDALLAEYPITSLKWDMNRDLTHAVDAKGRPAASRQTHAVYGLIDRLRSAHPALEIESCASGGGRADYGILARTHRIWTSDCTDALERLDIQRGAARFFPREVLGAHVSSSPNHQTGRRHSLAFRSIVALAYHFGVELNPLELSGHERSEMKDWIALHKRLRPLLHAPVGQFDAVPEDGRYVWGSESEDKIVLFVAQRTLMRAEQPPPLRAPILLPTKSFWRVAQIHPQQPDFIRASKTQKAWFSGETEFRLQSLTGAGLPFPPLRPESAVVLEIERIKKD